VVASFASYALEKRLSKTPERFGQGAIEGVAGPESANNAAAGGAFIPLMTLGIPPNVVMALLLGAFVIHGLQPGPLMITQNPGLFWGIVASMYIGNLMLLVLNLPMIGMWVQLLKLPYNILFPLIILFTIIGVYCSSNNVFDVYVMIAFGVIGYFHAQARLRAGAAGAGLRARADAGKQSAQVADPVAGRSDDLRAAADLGGVPARSQVVLLVGRCCRRCAGSARWWRWTKGLAHSANRLD
jgi:hypothetical protein